MAFALELSALTQIDRITISNACTYRPPPTQFLTRPVPKKCYIMDKADDTLYLPLGCWKDHVDKFPNGDQSDFPQINKKIKFNGNLLTVETDPMERNRDQDVVVAEALKKLEKNGTVFLALHTGFGKTLTAIYLCIKLRLKTIIITHFDIIKSQWIDDLHDITRNVVKIQILDGKCELDPHADVYIIGVLSAAKSEPERFFDIGTVIIDEAQVATDTMFTYSVLKFRPRYFIGLSATPDRKDGFHTMFPLFFGHNNVITRREIKNFTVYKYQTNFKPTIEHIVYKGRSIPKWSTVINSIEENPLRWELIANLAIKHDTDKIIILCDRKAQSKGIYNYLLDKKEDVEILIESTKKWNKDARILVAGTKKAGVGFNDPKLTMAIIASDTSDVRQYEGRIRTTDNVIYHVVDNYASFEKHYKMCEPWYLERGATIHVVGHKKRVTKTPKKLPDDDLLSL